jgi:hypothetical protein
MKKQLEIQSFREAKEVKRKKKYLLLPTVVCTVA